MSFLFNWDKLTKHDAENVQKSMQEYLDSAKLPDWISCLRVEDFDWGTEPPLLEIVDATEPLDLFRLPRSSNFPSNSDFNFQSSRQHSPARQSFAYAPSAAPTSESSSTETSAHTNPHFQNGHHYQPPPPPTIALQQPYFNLQQQSILSPPGSPTKLYQDLPPNTPIDVLDPQSMFQYQPQPPNPFDTQLVVNFEYSGDISIKISTEISLNVPSSAFISLPVTFKLVRLKIRASLAFVWIGSKVHISIFEPNSKTSVVDDLNLSSSLVPFELGFQTDWEVGDVEKPVLKNATKIEKFLHEVMLKFIHENLIYPQFYSFNLSSTDDEDIQDADLD